ncbi:MAG: hypothetical protein V4618_00680 [Pseudomonadota bacterium]
MSEQAQTLALVAAQTATESIRALITYGREGGEVDDAVHCDMLYPLVAALRIGIEAVAAARGDGHASDDDQLLCALVKWIED